MFVSRSGRTLLVVVLIGLLVPTVAARGETAEQRRAEARRALQERGQEHAAVENDLLAALDAYAAAGIAVDAANRRLGRLDDALATATRTAAGIEDLIDKSAVAAYMSAVSGDPAVVLDSRSVEEAIVATELVSRAHSDSVTELADLIGRLDELEELRTARATEVDTLSQNHAALSARTAELSALLATVDAELATAFDAAEAAEAEVAEAEVAEAGAAEAEAAAGAAVRKGPKPVQTPPATGWRALVSRYFPPDLVDPALVIITCESGGDPTAVNPATGAAGLFQFLPGTWAVASTRAGVGDRPAFDPEANVAAASWLAETYRAATGDPWRPWGCRSAL